MDISTKSVQDFASSVASKFLVRPTGADSNIIGTGGFLFHIIDQEEVMVEAEATDHYVEKNYAIQDHVSIRPVMFTLKGFMGELNDISFNQMLAPLTNIQSLGDIGGLAPNFSQQAAQAYSKITSVTAKVNSVINQAHNICDIFNAKSTTKTQAQKAFSFFFNLLQNRLPCSVETPFDTFDNMLVLRVGNVSRGDTKQITDFSVTFKQIRVVETITITPKVAAGRAQGMLSSAVAKGQAVAKKVSVDIISVKS